MATTTAGINNLSVTVNASLASVHSYGNEIDLNALDVLKVLNTSDASSSNNGSLVIAGGLGVNNKLITGSGLYLPPSTSGGLAAQLNYYEHYDSPELDITGAYNETGTGNTITLHISRIGRNVTITWVGKNFATGVYVSTGTTISSDYLFLAGKIPTRFRPIKNQSGIYTGSDGTPSAQYVVGAAVSGNVVFAYYGGYWPIGVTATIYGGNISYNI